MRNHIATSLCNLGISLLFIWLSAVPRAFREALEYRGYDAMTAFLSLPKTTSPIVLIDVNDQALETFGPWPWSRTRIADLRVIRRRFVCSGDRDSYRREYFLF
jgi:CHASE2 domain-containing sensor protein